MIAVNPRLTMSVTAELVSVACEEVISPKSGLSSALGNLLPLHDSDRERKLAARKGVVGHILRVCHLDGTVILLAKFIIACEIDVELGLLLTVIEEDELVLKLEEALLAGDKFIRNLSLSVLNTSLYCKAEHLPVLWGEKLVAGLILREEHSLAEKRIRLTLRIRILLT